MACKTLTRVSSLYGVHKNIYFVVTTAEPLISDPHKTRLWSEHNIIWIIRRGKYPLLQVLQHIYCQKSTCTQQIRRLVSAEKAVNGDRVKWSAEITIQSRRPRHALSSELRAQKAVNRDCIKCPHVAYRNREKQDLHCSLFLGVKNSQLASLVIPRNSLSRQDRI